VAYFSRACRGAEANYHSSEGELLAAVWGIFKARQYIGGREFTLVTDSSPLQALRAKENLTGKIARWAVFLSEFEFTVRHRPGRIHGNADGASRGPHPAEAPDELDEKLAEVWQLSARQLVEAALQGADEDDDASSVGTFASDWDMEDLYGEMPLEMGTSVETTIVDCNVALREHR
jgi:RNase H-like domain found in reverse transcriptase